MGYTPGVGTKGLGEFTASSSTTADLNKLLELIALVGNYRGALTEDERDDIVGDALYAGLLVFNTDSARLEIYNGTGWTPAVWKALSVGARKGATQAIPASTMTNVLSVSLPADAPAGVYQVIATVSTWSGSATSHFKQVRYGGTSTPGSGTVFPGTGDAITMSAGAAGSDVPRTFVGKFTHAGGAITVWLDAQVNGGSPNANPECSLNVTLIGFA